MKNYVYIYHSNQDTPPTAEAMTAWSNWFKTLGDNLVDGGNPITGPKFVLKDGQAVQEKDTVIGYSIVKAESMDEAVKMAKELDASFSHARILNADADSSSFVNRGIPAITFHGLNQNWRQYLHTSSDKFENLKVPLVLNGYSFVLRYIARLDGRPCSEFRK